MRLLDTHNLQLKSFFDKIPPYAILSHCWEEEEVLLPDLNDLDKARAKKGFSKIEGSCAQAIKDGFDYCWVDTCCIDKSSSAELSEAINSMFAWYRDSSVCYAYLLDVKEMDGFAKSKWFTRAWTLQELLAPGFRTAEEVLVRGNDSGLLSTQSDGSPDVVFFTLDWTPLGTKDSLSTIISNITGIPKEYLKGLSLRDASISMRMSWASDRQATRAEDMAYSLLGLFDVNMPLLYGEGGLKAFRRLQEEIMKMCEDETLLAWESTDLQMKDSSMSALARHPKDFWEARDLVPYASDAPSMPYAMTHRGLRIWLSIFSAYIPGNMSVTDRRRHIKPLRSPIMIWKSRDGNLLWGILRCHVAHDFHNTVLIPLRHLTADVYQRDVGTSVALIATNNLPGRAQMKEVYIGTSHSFAISSSRRRRYSWLIRTLPPDCTITRVLPEKWWNPKDRTVQGDVYGTGRQAWYATIQLGLTSSTFSQSTSILMTIKNTPTNRSERPDAQIDINDTLRWDDPERPPSECQKELELYHRNVPFERTSPQPSRFKDAEGKLYDFHMNVTCSREVIMGQWMFVMDVEYRENDPKPPAAHAGLS